MVEVTVSARRKGLKERESERGSSILIKTYITYVASRCGIEVDFAQTNITLQYEIFSR